MRLIKNYFILFAAALITIMMIGIISVLSTSNTIKAQEIIGINDSKYVYTFSEFQSGQLVEIVFIGESLSTGQLLTVRTNSNDVVIESRPATISESVTYYNALIGINSANAYNRITGEVEPGSNYERFVSNHVAQSQSCVDDLDVGLSGPDFESLGINARNMTVDRIMECQRHSSFVETKVLQSLLDILITNGLVE